MPIGEVGERIRDALLRLIDEAGDLVEGTIGVTRNTTVQTLRGVRDKATQASRVAGEAVSSAIHAGSEAGTDLGSISKGAVIGVIRGVGEVTRVTQGVISETVRAAIKGTSEVGGDVATVAKKAMEGAIEAGKEAGLKAEDAASAGAFAAIEAAGEISEAVATAVTRAVTGTISDVRVVLKAPFKRQVILAVDSNRHDLELLTQYLGGEGYEIRSASSLAELDQAIQQGQKIAVALIDLSGFDEHIWERCEKLREAKIPFLVISPRRSLIVQKDSLRHGASGVLVKPISFKELGEHIRTLLGG